MALRLNSLQTRTALAIISVIVVSLMLNGIYLIVRQRAEVHERIEQEALNFAELTTGIICTAYSDYYNSGFYKFRELIKDRMRLNPDVERILFGEQQPPLGGAAWIVLAHRAEGEKLDL